MARLLSVNVGQPRDVAWRGKTVHTGVWKEAVQGRRRVSRLNVEGDGQGDLGGHGGEQRAVLVYQMEAYRYWAGRLGRDNYVFGQFGENFTVDGLSDDVVCIGDRYRIGTALLEVSQPRVTCYRVGVRMDEPLMPSMLTSSGRPGFYLRVIEEGEVGAGDPIVQISRDSHGMTVAAVNSLLYSSAHPRDQLLQALKVPALSPGWRRSFEALLRSQDSDPHATGNAGLMPVVPRAAAGFTPLRVVRVSLESADVVSLVLRRSEPGRLSASLPGQFVVVRLRPDEDGPPLFRSYSLSGAVSDEEYRISVKVEPGGRGGAYLSAVREGDVLEVSEPRGSFTLQPGEEQLVLVSGGIGATPVLAMLHALASCASPREVWWLHAARNGAADAFASEVRRTLGMLPQARSQIWYSRPSEGDRQGRDYDAVGRVTVAGLERLGVRHDGDFYVCGPPGFIAGLNQDLRGWGVSPERIHSELFSGGPSLAPGVTSPSSQRAPHQPSGAPGAGPLVSFARSGISTPWRSNSESVLELAEACDVPVRWSCRSGVCHQCESGLISGSVTYLLEPLDPPAEGNVLICCCRPHSDVVIDI